MEMETEESPTTAVDPSCPPFPHLQPQQEDINEELPVLELPTLDLVEGFDRAALVAACRELGVFRLVNHGVPGDLSGRLFELAQEMLGRVPFERKKAQPGYFWGTPALSLRVKDINWVEGFHFQHQSDAPDSTDHADADDTAAASAFSLLRTLSAEYCTHMARIARKLFDALAAELGLDAHQTASYLAERHGTFRVYRYPPSGGSYQLGMEPHTDSSVLSILSQDLVGGLQLLHKDEDAWYNVVPVPGTLLVNLGDMMQAISGDAYRSVRHRVVASPATERLSLCYFAFPQDDAVIVCPSRCSGYRPFSYREFREQVQADIKATGSKVGLQRFLAANYI